MRFGGWFHRIGGNSIRVVPLAPEPPKPKINVTELMREWSKTTEPDWIRALAFELGVSYQSLTALGAAWCPSRKAWAFTMVNGWGEPVGIRLRAENGSKFSYGGDHNGLLIPNMQPQSTAWISEGPTSAAALITMGLFPVSRPNNSGCLDQVSIACKRLGVTRAVIVADNDSDKPLLNGTTFNPGVDSSIKLQGILKIPSCIYIPPCKDVRAGLKLGLTREIIQSTVKNLVWYPRHSNSPFAPCS